MKTYVIAPHHQTARYYAQAFGLSSDPRRTITLGSNHALPAIKGLGAGEFYVVNSDNGAIAREVILELLVLEQCHPESVTVEWIGFGDGPHVPPPDRDEDTVPEREWCPLDPWLRRSSRDGGR